MDLQALKADVFDPVVRRLKSRAESLTEIRRFERTGIEGWLKVEAVAALGSRVEQVKNKGPDLVVRGVRVELKAATDLNAIYILGGLNYETPCLFLGGGSRPDASIERLRDRAQLVAVETFSDGKHDWVLGLIVPRTGPSEASRQQIQRQERR